MSPAPVPHHRRTYEASELWREFPHHADAGNKKLVFELAYPGGSAPAREIDFAQWTVMELPDTAAPADVQFQASADYFTYDPVDADAVEWHLNFADPDLFGYYASDLFAQDELQICEHPVLACVREALATEGLAYTEKGEKPYPVTLKNVERRCRFDLSPLPALDLPHGLYGNAFASASEEAIRATTTIIDPPQYSNLLAIAAPRPASGRYTMDQIAYILKTAYSGFRAAGTESRINTATAPGNIVIHTGWWGCGAFGGNRELMVMLQYLAAVLAGVRRLQFHAGDHAGVLQAKAAAMRIGEYMQLHANLHDLLDLIYSQGYQWGRPNGS